MSGNGKGSVISSIAASGIAVRVCPGDKSGRVGLARNAFLARIGLPKGRLITFLVFTCLRAALLTWHPASEGVQRIISNIFNIKHLPINPQSS
jgi:hypothetical protein